MKTAKSGQELERIPCFEPESKWELTILPAACFHYQ